MKTAQYVLKNSLVGDLYIVASEDALLNVSWTKQSAPLVKSLDAKSSEIKILSKVVKQLNEYFEGRRTNFDIPLSIEGTSFQKNVWRQLRAIPYGKTLAYKDIAKKIKNEKAVRAVGTANGRNSIAIVIPCHRVIAADGTMGGFGGGLINKAKLLHLEKIALKAKAA
ncbi:MAG: methylated-DNA--[protein]-cysteine S-methyltransferase [Deltaproteobacteria bacterium]|nr:methylated-DNA--[protein]-cysteine S-methyltransferase [Deltaproteobacteria bacterium]